ncbi:hypothetical protein LTR84_011164 [Exophiala bonariae]|uniref:BHLH domain-containing protein n=1 Tax=Exophiala bonariae TaxID=1690606 RepID=A0AAV9NIE2_9EURO|nr:hypothetical protein LTR84_011164 [Exophiala bonariae]
MSKNSLLQAEGPYSDPAPSYEESVRSTTWTSQNSHSRPTGEKSLSSIPSSVPSMIRQERTRRIQNLIVTEILPCFSSHLTNSVNNLTIVIVPSNSLPDTCHKLNAASLVTPSFQSLSTTGAVIALSGEDNQANFWTQHSVMQELNLLLHRELTGKFPERDPLSERHEHRPESQYGLKPQASPSMPERPQKKSWLKRALPQLPQLPGPEHDPTGETGKWNLGWRSPLPENLTAQVLNPDEIAVHTKLQEASLRTESEMGLLETTTAKCIWIKIEVGI